MLYAAGMALAAALMEEEPFSNCFFLCAWEWSFSQRGAKYGRFSKFLLVDPSCQKHHSRSVFRRAKQTHSSIFLLTHHPQLFLPFPFLLFHKGSLAPSAKSAVGPLGPTTSWCEPGTRFSTWTAFDVWLATSSSSRGTSSPSCPTASCVRSTTPIRKTISV